MLEKPVNPASRGQPRLQPAWWTWVLLGLSGFFLFFALLLSLLKGAPSSWLPAHLHSVLFADYSQDPFGKPIAQVNFSVIRDLLYESFQPGDADPDQRYAAVINQLETPVPTVTSMPGSTVFVPTVLPTMTTTPPTPTPGSATPTLVQSPSVTPTATSTLTPSPTATWVIGQPTATSRPPTQGPGATRTSAPQDTNTPVPTRPPATATPRPTQPPTSPPYPSPPTPYP